MTRLRKDQINTLEILKEKMMPTYEYECRECNHQFESFQWVENRSVSRKRSVSQMGKKKSSKVMFQPMDLHQR